MTERKPERKEEKKEPIGVVEATIRGPLSIVNEIAKSIELGVERKTTPERKEGGKGGVAEDVIGGFGLGGLLKSLEKSDAFRKRLEEVNREIEKRIREAPLRKAVPRIESSFSIRTLAPETGGKPAPAFQPKKRTRSLDLGKEAPGKEELVDVFDEKDKVMIVTALPGVKKRDIKVKLKGRSLTISAGDRHKQVSLPSAVKGKIKKRYKNNILEIILNKG